MSSGHRPHQRVAPAAGISAACNFRAAEKEGGKGEAEVEESH